MTGRWKAALQIAEARRPRGEVAMTELMMMSQTVVEMHDEIERLRAANRGWLEYSQREIEPELKAQVAELTVEAKRLRAALREVLEDYERYGGTSWKEPLHDPDILRRAKEALRHD